MNPYEVLGIEPTATADEITAAYRRAASAAHPDRAGGCADKMSEVNRAYQVLGDPAARARFDATGDAAAEASVDEQATELMVMLLKQFIDQASRDPVAAAVGRLRELHAGLTSAAATARRQANTMDRLLPRVRVRGERPNVVAPMIEARAKALRSEAESKDKQLAVTSHCLELLADFSIEPEADEFAPSMWTAIAPFKNATSGLEFLLGQPGA